MPVECPELCWCRIQVLYINIYLHLKCRVVNVWWIESQCIFKAAQKGLCRCPSYVREMKQSTFIFSPLFFSPFHSCILKSSLFFLHTYTRVKLKLPKKNVCKTFCNTFCTIRGPTAMLTCGKLMYIFFRFINHVLRHCFCSFWVTVALFVLCPFVKLFLNVYTWFSNCLFCTFNFIIRQCKLFPWCLEDHIV